MAVYKCKMCGGTIDFNPGESVGICEFCGTKQTLPKTDDEVITNLFNRANNLRLKCEFDKAEQIYEKIVQQDDSEAEAHWGIVLCKYGIEYVEDPKTFNRVPTCHRTSFESIKTDADYEAAICYADSLQKSIFEKEADEIDRLQKDILILARKEEPFDVFICYKETDEYGRRTIDSTLANDIYYQLSQSGLKVFYAAISLEDKLGQEYEPYIFAALNSAKVMLVIGTKPEFFTSVWVKNEWSRFLHFMKTDRNKLLIPCYRDMDPYDLPDEFAHLQAQDMSRIGFLQDIIRGVEKVIGKDKGTQSLAPQVNASAGPSTSALLKRGFILLEDLNWSRAREIFDQILNFDAECADAYLGLFMAEHRVKDIASVEKSLQDPDFENNIKSSKDIQRMLKYNNGERSEGVKAVILHHNEQHTSYETNKSLTYEGSFIPDIVINDNEVILEGFDGYNKWIVLRKEGDNWLLLSKYMQDYREVQKYIPYIWDNSAIKEYLNTEFIKKFTEGQRDRLQIPSQCGTNGVNDKVFLMSEDEYNALFPSKEDDRRIMRREVDNLPEIWALRSKDKKGKIQYVTKDGHINSKDGNSLFAGITFFGIRPLIWLNISKSL